MHRVAARNGALEPIQANGLILVLLPLPEGVGS